MIRINSLSKKYKEGKGKEVNALCGVSLDLPDQGLVFITGKSGSGKSTFLNLLGGLDSPTEGEIIIDGRSSKDFKENDFCAYRNEYVGFVFQEYKLISQYSVGANVALALELHGKSKERELVEDALRKLELVDGDRTLYDRAVNTLSGGQKQRVAIARAIVKDPKLILADEPTGALDSETGRTLYELLKKLSEEKLVVVITHDRECAEQYGDRIIELKDGRILSDSAEQASTDERKDSAEQERTAHKSGRLPFKRILTMGLNGLKFKKLRLAFSVVLAVIAFTLFGFAVTAATINYMDVQLNTAYKHGVKIVMLRSRAISKTKTVYHGGQFDGLVIYGNSEYDGAGFQADQLEKIAKRSPIMPVRDNLNKMIIDDGDYHTINIENATKELIYNKYVYFLTICNIVYLDPETGEDDASLSPDPRLTAACRLPQNDKEIAITDYTADMFMRLGYKDVDGDGATYAISNPDELIGKTINGYTICGVYTTGNETQRFKARYDKDYTGPIYDNLAGGIPFDPYYEGWINGFHMMRCAFMHESAFDQSDFDHSIKTQLLYKLSGSKGRDKAFFNEIISHKYVEYLEDTSSEYVNWTYTSTLETSYTGFSKTTLVSLITNPKTITGAIVISIILAIFGTLLLMSFLLFGFDARKKEIGVLRAMGARKADISLICLTEAVLIALADLLLSLLSVGIICAVLNAKVYITLFFMGAIPIFTMIGLCLIAAVLASLPSLKITREKPVEIIRENA